MLCLLQGGEQLRQGTVGDLQSFPGVGNDPGRREGAEDLHAAAGEAAAGKQVLIVEDDGVASAKKLGAFPAAEGASHRGKLPGKGAENTGITQRACKGRGGQQQDQPDGDKVGHGALGQQFCRRGADGQQDGAVKAQDPFRTVWG